MPMMLILTLGFLACLILKDMLCIFCFTLFFLVYLYYRFKDKRILALFILLSLFSCILVYPKEFKTYETYKVVEIKKGYCIGKNKGSKIFIQTDLDLSFQDEVKVKHIEPIHTDDNFTLFSFTKYNENKNIRFKTNSIEIIHKSTSLKSRLYNYLKSKPNSSIVLSLYYGIHDETIDEIYTMLGYGYMSAYYIVLHLLKRKYDETKIRRILLVFSILFGHFFVYTLSLSRFILYQLSTLFFTSKPNQIAFTILLFGILYPNQVLSISFVCPLLLQLVSYFCTEHKWIVQKLVLIGLMFIYFKKVNLISLLFFNILRKLYGLIFIFGFIVQDLINLKLPELTIHYAPRILFVILFIVFYIQCLKHFKWKYLLILFVPLLEIYCNPFFQVYTLNLGQADCSVIVEPFHKSVVMIDCGQNLYRDNVERIIMPFLENKNIHTIDTLILTHDDFDHNGGYDSLKDKIKIKQVIEDSNQSVNVDYPFYLLLSEREAKDTNDSSIISYFTYDHLTYLFMGDVSKQIERQLIAKYDLKADVIKVGHHGSNTSSDPDFLDSLDCKIALISCGYKNKYGHPSVETLKTLENLHINTLCTSDCGSIAIYSLFHLSFLVTNDGMFGIIWA
mgnify:FL=1